MAESVVSLGVVVVCETHFQEIAGSPDKDRTIFHANPPRSSGVGSGFRRTSLPKRCTLAAREKRESGRERDGRTDRQTDRERLRES